MWEIAASCTGGADSGPHVTLMWPTPVLEQHQTIDHLSRLHIGLPEHRKQNRSKCISPERQRVWDKTWMECLIATDSLFNHFCFCFVFFLSLLFHAKAYFSLCCHANHCRNAGCGHSIVPCPQAFLPPPTHEGLWLYALYIILHTPIPVCCTLYMWWGFVLCTFFVGAKLTI